MSYIFLILVYNITSVIKWRTAIFFFFGIWYSWYWFHTWLIQEKKKKKMYKGMCMSKKKRQVPLNHLQHNSVSDSMWCRCFFFFFFFFNYAQHDVLLFLLFVIIFYLTFDVSIRTNFDIIIFLSLSFQLSFLSQSKY